MLMVPGLTPINPAPKTCSPKFQVLQIVVNSFKRLYDNSGARHKACARSRLLPERVSQVSYNYLKNKDNDDDRRNCPRKHYGSQTPC